jgi:hypothetical protein
VVKHHGKLPRSHALGETGNANEHPAEPVLDPTCHKVLFGIPLKGHTPPASYHDRMLMWKYLGDRECADFYEKKVPRYSFALACLGELMVAYARERFAETAIESGSDYLFMVDDDMLCPPDLFYRLVAHDKDICAALAFTRNPDHKPVIYDVIEGFDPITRTSYGKTKFAMNYPRNQLVQCDAVGFGAVLIKTKVIKAIFDRRETCFFGMDRTGEDVAFCTKARKLGFEVWMDTSTKLGHLGAPTVITEEYADQWLGLSPQEREKFYGQYTRYPSMEMQAVSRG